MQITEKWIHLSILFRTIYKYGQKIAKNILPPSNDYTAEMKVKQISY